MRTREERRQDAWWWIVGAVILVVVLLALLEDVRCTPALRGLFVALGGGYLAVEVTLRALYRYQGLTAKPMRAANEPRRVPPWLTGVIERGFFTVLVAYDVSGAATAMMAWMGLKLATNWNRVGNTQSPELWSAWAFSALIGGIVSLLFAVLGGFIWGGKL